MAEVQNEYRGWEMGKVDVPPPLCYPLEILMVPKMRRDGRAVEGARLERV